MKSWQKHFHPNFAHNVNFPRKWGNFFKNVLARFVALCVQICGPVCADFQKATNNLVKDSNAECGTECGTGDLSCTDLAHNASIP